MFRIGPVSGHSLFQILIEKVVATVRRYNTSVPLYVMTSPATHEETVEYLAANHRFGLPAEDLRHLLPGNHARRGRSHGQVDSARKLLALAPDGHGGMLEAMSKSGALQHARDRHIDLFSYGQIDNPLLHLCHPELIGYHLLAESEMTSQVIRKVDPLERVGNVVMVDGKMHIIEYSDLPPDIAQQRNPDDSLYIWAGSIAVHVFDAAFLQRIVHRADALPFHRAKKKVPFVDAQGVAHTPDQPNALKFERFIFDLLPWAANTIVVEGDTAEVFAPVKNADGAAADTPTATKHALMRLHTQWLRKAGAYVQEGTPVEISPLRALDAEQVAQRIKLPCTLDQPTFLSRSEVGITMLHAMIMAGGSGTRFWPASRHATPKQLLQLAGEQTMIQATVRRLGSLVPASRVLVVTSARLVGAVASQLPDLPEASTDRRTLPARHGASDRVGRSDHRSARRSMPPWS